MSKHADRGSASYPADKPSREQSQRYAVIGNPIDHSLSPQIHSAFAEQLGQSIDYRKLRADDDGFDAVASEFFRSGGAGLNVTVPFKRIAFRWVDDLSEPAEQAGAVNTIAWRDGRLLGHNTDGVGLVADLQSNVGAKLAGASVLIVGAGGAARGAIGPLLEAGAARILVANRTHGNAQELVARFDGFEGRLGASGLDIEGQFDVVLHASAAVRRGSLPAIRPSVLSGALCYDLDYSRDLQQTAFCRFAHQCGARSVHDGLGMLVEQAAAAYAIWRGVAPATAPVYEHLRSALGRQRVAD